MCHDSPEPKVRRAVCCTFSRERLPIESRAVFGGHRDKSGIDRVRARVLDYYSILKNIEPYAANMQTCGLKDDVRSFGLLSYVLQSERIDTVSTLPRSAVWTTRGVCAARRNGDSSTMKCSGKPSGFKH